jgi:hypothetical protein
MIATQLSDEQRQSAVRCIAGGCSTCAARVESCTRHERLDGGIIREGGTLREGRREGGREPQGGKKGGREGWKLEDGGERLSEVASE